MNILPFPRGETLCGANVTAGDTVFESWQGRVIPVSYDTVFEKDVPLELMLVRNDSGAAITKGYHFFKPSAADTTADFPMAVSGVTDALGQFGYLIDPAYGASPSIADNDLFCVVRKGLGKAKAESTTVSLSANAAFVADALGRMDGAAPAAGAAVLGRVMRAADTTGQVYTVYIDGSVVGGEGT